MASAQEPPIAAATMASASTEASDLLGLHDIISTVLDSDYKLLRLVDLFALMRTSKGVSAAVQIAEHWETLYCKYTAQCIHAFNASPSAFRGIRREFLIRQTWDDENGLLPAMCPPSAIAEPGRMQMNVLQRIRSDDPLRSPWMKACQCLLATSCHYCGALAANVNPVVLERACKGCSTSQPGLRTLTRSKAKEKFLLTDKDIDSLPFAWIASPYRALNGKDECTLFSYVHVRLAALKRWGSEQGLIDEIKRRKAAAVARYEASLSTDKPQKKRSKLCHMDEDPFGADPHGMGLPATLTALHVDDTLPHDEFEFTPAYEMVPLNYSGSKMVESYVPARGRLDLLMLVSRFETGFHGQRDGFHGDWVRLVPNLRDVPAQHPLPEMRRLEEMPDLLRAIVEVEPLLYLSECEYQANLGNDDFPETWYRRCFSADFRFPLPPESDAAASSNSNDPAVATPPPVEVALDVDTVYDEGGDFIAYITRIAVRGAGLTPKIPMQILRGESVIYAKPFTITDKPMRAFDAVADALGLKDVSFGSLIGLLLLRGLPRAEAARFARERQNIAYTIPFSPDVRLGPLEAEIADFVAKHGDSF